MTKYIPTAMTVTWNSGAWAANYVKRVEWNETAVFAESTGASDTWTTRGLVNKSGSATITIYDDTTKALIADKWAVGTTSTLVFDPGDAGYTKSVTGFVESTP